MNPKVQDEVSREVADGLPMSRGTADPVPGPAVMSFALGVVAGLVALLGLLGVLGSGIAGEYNYTAVVIWAVASGAMIALFAVSIWLGARELKRQSIDSAFIRRRLAISMVSLLATGVTVPLVAAGIGSSALPALGDLFALVVPASLISCNLKIRRRLRENLK